MSAPANVSYMFYLRSKDKNKINVLNYNHNLFRSAYKRNKTRMIAGEPTTIGNHLGCLYGNYPVFG